MDSGGGLLASMIDSMKFWPLTKKRRVLEVEDIEKRFIFCLRKQLMACIFLINLKYADDFRVNSERWTIFESGVQSWIL